eukprot:2414-Alexandrium_andersonii.AAC.1
MRAGRRGTCALTLWATSSDHAALRGSGHLCALALCDLFRPHCPSDSYERLGIRAPALAFRTPAQHTACGPPLWSVCPRTFGHHVRRHLRGALPRAPVQTPACEQAAGRGFACVGYCLGRRCRRLPGAALATGTCAAGGWVRHTRVA